MHREPFFKGLFESIYKFIIYGGSGVLLGYTVSWILCGIRENSDQIDELPFRLKECEKNQERHLMNDEFKK